MSSGAVSVMRVTLLHCEITANCDQYSRVKLESTANQWNLFCHNITLANSRSPDLTESASQSVSWANSRSKIEHGDRYQSANESISK